ncbi:hypothetical protein [Lactobacillus helveticus]|uniref:hypothetical protein n=1 Tax=Lactobacillus helveticus TaxID=1587 RepID=UPI0011083110|nr:hypothetical protein [Lactobacillus helveticus]TLQ21749.1 hypothetical protein FEZ38_06490 [Lactobacillus helveticus]
MQLAVEDSSLEQVVDLIMKKRGYVPESQIVGRTISIQDFAKKYAKPHGGDWVKRNILYPFEPDWCSNIHPGRGGKMTIFEYPAAVWMNEHRKEIDWNAK